MKRPSLFVLLVGLIAVSVPLGAQQAVREVLPNGFTVIVKENHAAPVVAVRIYCKTGSAYEGRYLGAGVAHFLEHTLGKGTPTRTAEQINRLIEEIGNDANAYTSTDHTCYYINAGAEYFDIAAELLADYVLHPKFEKKVWEQQRDIILREMAMGEDDPSRRIYYLFQETAFQIHPSRYRVIGYPERFKSITYEDLLAFHRQWYVPDNMVAVVVGDVDTAHALKKLREVLSAAPRRGTPGFELPVEPRQLAPRRRIISADLKKAYLMLGYHTVSIAHPDLYPLDVLACILGRGRSSRLVRILKEQRKLVDSISCYSFTPRYDAGTFVVSAVLDADQLQAAEEAIREQLDLVRTKHVTKRELAQAKAQVAAARIFEDEEAENQADSLGVSEVMTGDMNFDDRYVENIRLVKAADIQRVAREYFHPENYTLVALTPKTEQRRIAAHRAQPGGIALRRLPHGIRLLVQESSAVPLVSLLAVFEGGLRYETPEDNGISSFMSAMLIRGTQRRTREQIARALDSVGGRISPWSGRDSLGLTVQVLKEDFERGLDVLADVIQNSTFPPEEVENRRRLQLAAIAREQDEAFPATFRLFLQTLFPQHPYGWRTVGTPEAVQSLTRDQLLAHYRRICRPDNLILCVFGDISADEAEAAVTRAFARFVAEGERRTPRVAPEAPITKVRELTKQRDQEQAILVFGWHGLSAASADRYALDVLDAAFSGPSLPGGRLHETLRGKGLVYATHLVTADLTDPGYIMLYAACAPEKLDETEKTIKRLVQGIIQAPMSEEEIKRGKSMCISNQQLSLQTNAARATTAALDELRELGYDNYTKYAAAVKQVTAADVQRVAAKYMDLNKCVIVRTVPRRKEAEPPAE